MTAYQFDELLRVSALRPLYQPIVHMETGEVVGVEALARWPELAEAQPHEAFAHAARVGRLQDLDRACQAAALEQATGALGRGQTLFVNAEPATMAEPAPELDRLADGAATAGIAVVVEMTERSILADPAAVLTAADRIRERGWRIALDDVGAEPDSLAMLPFIRPDVVKLDLAIVQQTPTREQARTMAAVLADAERRGTTILAEGIESPAHVEQAIALGATYGQGWRYGRPGPPPPEGPSRPLAFGDDVRAAVETPYDLVEGRDDERIGRKSVILAMSRHIENQAQSLSDPPIVLSTFQTAERFTPATSRRYARLATTCPLVGAFGIAMEQAPAPDVRGTAITADDPLAGEWIVVVVGAHYAGALLARDIGDRGLADADRRFRFVITHDRDVVVEAGRSLMRRMATTGSVTPRAATSAIA